MGEWEKEKYQIKLIFILSLLKFKKKFENEKV